MGGTRVLVLVLVVGVAEGCVGVYGVRRRRNPAGSSAVPGGYDRRLDSTMNGPVESPAARATQPEATGQLR